MKILPIFFNNKISNNPITNKYQPPVITNPQLQTLKCDTVTFQSKAHPEEKLKLLLQYKLSDLYSDIVLLDNSILENALKRKIFSSPIKNVVKFLQMYKSSLFPIEKQVLNLLEHSAQKQPKKTLEQIIHDQFAKHNKILMEEQKPIFEKLTEYSKEMPSDLKQEFDSLMELYNNKIQHKSVVVPFSVKEFKYKLDRISESIRSRNIRKERQVLQKLLKMSENFINPKEHVIQEKVNTKKRSIASKKPKDLTRHNSEVLRQMEKVLYASSLKDDRELNNLFIMSKSQIYKIPTLHPFKRKSFIYNLNKITSKLEDQKLGNLMLKTALELPTSKNSLSAFIVNEALNSSEKIGYDLLVNSLGTIEHIKPQIKGGENELNNMALASKYKNNTRAHTAISTLMRKEPHLYETFQKHIDRLVELYNTGIFRKIGLSKGYITNLAYTLENLSPEENPLKINLSELTKN